MAGVTYDCFEWNQENLKKNGDVICAAISLPKKNLKVT